MKGYTFLENTADIKIRSTGKTEEEAFLNCAYGIKEVITKNKKIQSKISKKINVKAKDKESLLYKFLEEFIYLVEAENFIFSKIENLKIRDKELSCKIYGDSFSNYNTNNEIKSITYSEIEVKKEENKFFCQVVLDV